MATVIDEAKKALGEAAAGDWRLLPETHADALSEKAGALQRILRKKSLQEIICKYRVYDSEAVGAQKTYKRQAKASAIAGFLAILVGSVFILPGYANTPPVVIEIATAVQAVLITVSLGLSILVGHRKPFEQWMEKRALAENSRQQLFDDVMKEAEHEEKPGELPLLPLQLEYFRRYQLDVQRNYYRGRGREHLSASRAARNWRIVALVLLAVSAFPIFWSLQSWLPERLLSALPNETLLAEQVFLAFSVVASGLQGLLAAYAVISLNDRNAARYLATANNLDDLAKRPLEEARGLAAAGNRAGVLAFVALVQQEISFEHREWIALRKIAPDLSLDRLATLRLPKLE